jgi:hypothetical protein
MWYFNGKELIRGGCWGQGRTNIPSKNIPETAESGGGTESGPWRPPLIAICSFLFALIGQMVRAEWGRMIPPEEIYFGNGFIYRLS